MKIILATLLSLLLVGCASTGSTFRYEKQDTKLFIESDSDLAGLTVKRNKETGELEVSIGPIDNSSSLEDAAAGIITILPQLLTVKP